MHEIRLNFADIVLALRFSDLRVAQAVGEQLSGFLTNRPGEGIIEVVWRHLEESDLPTKDVQMAIPQGELSDDQYRVSWDYFQGSYDLKEAVGHCSVKGMFGLQKFLWALLTVLLVDRDGFVLHAASVSDGQRAYVFPAKSGTGKSTLVRNSPDKIVLSDEGTLVRLVDGRLYAYGSPFRSDQFRDFAFRKVPVAGFYLLVQSPQDRIVSLSKADACERVLSEVFVCSTKPSLRLQIFRLVAQAVDVLHANELQLTNSASFWRCLYDDLEGKTGSGIPASGG